MFIVETVRQFVRELLRDDRKLRVAAVRVVAGVARIAAKILAPAPAEFAGAIDVPQPADTDPLARSANRVAPVANLVDPPDDLMAGE